MLQRITLLKNEPWSGNAIDLDKCQSDNLKQDRIVENQERSVFTVFLATVPVATKTNKSQE